MSVEEQKDVAAPNSDSDGAEELKFDAEDYRILDKVSEDMRSNLLKKIVGNLTLLLMKSRIIYEFANGGAILTRASNEQVEQSIAPLRNARLPLLDWQFG